ncbi:NucA/NucB deoxyribonuclease domain-containing protein [Streptomyces sp. NBC_00342]|uniref:NucA/NucB deoxyribonuclease domain-containing protein n=1 Tax=Streptomyces sp. NBC_00342 TaxID=2975718 RepID=UPI002E2DCDA7|nr:NucA/NucB deoxyribonuclease domain-containing protein [Streptomyces sp. NBC_00342]
MRISAPRKAVIGATLGTLLLTGISTATAQAAPAEYRVTVVQAPAVKNVYVNTPAAASCKINTITLTRTSMCMDIGARVDLLKNGKPVGSATFDIKHSMTLKTSKLKWTESFTVGKAKLINAGGIRMNLSVGGGKGVKTAVKFPQGSTLGAAHKGTIGYAATVGKKKQLTSPASYRFTFTKPGYTTGGFTYNSGKYRCDDTFWGPKKRTKNPGCVFPSASPVFSLSRSDAKVKQSANHILDAQRKITGHPGASTPLHRITNEKTISAHRKAMCAKVRNPDPKKYDCDEYPFAASKEGGNPARGSTRIISAGDNRSAGARLGGFYKAQRVLNGDGYYVGIK